MAVYTPVIRLPKRKPSLAVMSNNNIESVLNNGNNSNGYEMFEPKDCLVSDTLFLNGLPSNIRENDIKALLQHCMPTEVILDRENDAGQLRFSHTKYADRAFSLYNGFTFTNNSKLELQISQDKRLEPEAKAVLLEINGLPEYFDENKLYDVFRRFGPLNLCKCVMKDGAFRGTALLQFFLQYDSDYAEREMNDHSLEGNILSVIPFMPSKTHAIQQQKQQQNEESEEQGSVDIMNLYITNLEHHITNQKLNELFRKFGRIVSARVMTNPATGQSKGYGFVSFGKSEEAAAALKEMNGVMIGNKPLTVAYHEPRKGRSNNNGSTNGINGNMGNMSNMGNMINMSNMSNIGYNNNNDFNTNNQYYSSANNSYYNNSAMSERSINNNISNISPSTPINGLGIDSVDELGINMNLKDLSIGQRPANLHPTTINLPPRKLDVNNAMVQNKLSPQFSSSPISGTSTGKSLASLASGLSIQPPPPSMHNQQQHYQQQQQQQQQYYSPLTIPSNINTSHINTTTVNLGQNGRPTLRRKGSLESVMTETNSGTQRMKLVEAVRNCGDYENVMDDIVDLLLTLKRKERSICLFNPDFLKEKIQLALDCLATCPDSEESDGEEEDSNGVLMDVNYHHPKSPLAINYINRKPMSPIYSPVSRTNAVSATATSPTSDIMLLGRNSKAIPIVAPSSPPAIVSGTSSSSTTTATDKKVIAATTTTTTTTTTTATPTTSINREEVDALLISLEGKPVHEKKQLLGDKLFPLVKSTGTKQAPKITISLLDTVDLHELAHIMYDTPLLKTRVKESFDALQKIQNP